MKILPAARRRETEMREGGSYLSYGPRKQAGSSMEVSKQLSVSPAVRWQEGGRASERPSVGES